MDKRHFLISIDTEGDDQWNWVPGSEVTTENSLFIPRFQALCEKYGFKPTYLTDYKMAKDPRFVEFAKEKSDAGLCEIGMHLHAWSSEPHFELKGNITNETGHCPYLIEYPDEVMAEKTAAVTTLLTDTFQTPVTTHRAGRWAMNTRYFKILKNEGYKVDCSVTPGVNWQNCPGFTPGSVGSDYSGSPERPYETEGLLEVPMTVRHLRVLPPKSAGTPRETLGRIKRYLSAKKELWLRPTGHNLNDMLYLTDFCYKSGDEYIMFMLHSSELMPGGSWRFDSEEKIEKLYSDIEMLFSHIAERFEGATIKEYGEQAVNK